MAEVVNEPKSVPGTISNIHDNNNVPMQPQMVAQNGSWSVPQQQQHWHPVQQQGYYQQQRQWAPPPQYSQNSNYNNYAHNYTPNYNQNPGNYNNYNGGNNNNQRKPRKFYNKNQQSNNNGNGSGSGNNGNRNNGNDNNNNESVDFNTNKCYTCKPRGTVEDHTISETDNFKFHHDMFRRPFIIMTSKVHYHTCYDLPDELQLKLISDIKTFVEFWNIHNYMIMFNNGAMQTHHHFHVKIKINDKMANRMRRDHFERKEREKRVSSI